ncbi:MAG: hypothetical protein ACOCP8_10330 [archaeon]
MKKNQLSTSTLMELNGFNKKIPFYKKIIPNYNGISMFHKCHNCHSKDIRYLDTTFYQNKTKMTDKTKIEISNIIESLIENNHYYCANCGLTHSYYISDY